PVGERPYHPRGHTQRGSRPPLSAHHSHPRRPCRKRRTGRLARCMNLLSEIKEGTRISWEAIRGNLLRSVLTTLGIVIGIVTVTLMATAMEGLNGAFLDAISFLGTDVLHVDTREWFIDLEKKCENWAMRQKIT